MSKFEEIKKQLILTGEFSDSIEIVYVNESHLLCEVITEVIVCIDNNDIFETVIGNSLNGEECVWSDSESISLSGLRNSLISSPKILEAVQQYLYMRATRDMI